MPRPHVHRYETRLRWDGSTGLGYEAYDRSHELGAPPADTVVPMSSDPAFRGDPRRLNPEQLVVMAASSCQLLSFLAVSARARIDVVGYVDDASAEMPDPPDDDGPVRITRIVLRPQITVAGDTPPAKLERLVRIAHDECFVANSLRSEIVVEPVFHRVG